MLAAWSQERHDYLAAPAKLAHQPWPDIFHLEIATKVRPQFGQAQAATVFALRALAAEIIIVGHVAERRDI